MKHLLQSILTLFPCPRYLQDIMSGGVRTSAASLVTASPASSLTFKAGQTSLEITIKSFSKSAESAL
jgi:hypothetical protein